jgi:hypothetical protein
LCKNLRRAIRLLSLMAPAIVVIFAEQVHTRLTSLRGLRRALPNAGFIGCHLGEEVRMSRELILIAREAIVGWPETLRLCVLIVVVAVVAIVCTDFIELPALPFLMK